MQRNLVEACVYFGMVFRKFTLAPFDKAIVLELGDRCECGWIAGGGSTFIFSNQYKIAYLDMGFEPPSPESQGMKYG